MKDNQVAHFEIYAEDPEALSKFYSDMFDWKIEHMAEMNYRMVRTVETDKKGVPTKPGGINGGIVKRPQGYDARGWVNYVNVESVDGAVERAQKLGAKVTRGKSPVPNMGWFAMLIDPQGNDFAVWQNDPNAK